MNTTKLAATSASVLLLAVLLTVQGCRLRDLAGRLDKMEGRCACTAKDCCKDGPQEP